MSAPRICVLRAPGTNCDVETGFAFDSCGGQSERVHLFQLLEQPDLLDNFQILCVPGGFSYGDDIGAGVVFASQLRGHLGDAMQRFLSGDKLVLGICNGFQILCESHLLPGALTRNKDLHFICKDQELEIVNNKTLWTNDYQAGQHITIPLKNGEGSFQCDDQTLNLLESEGRIVARYVGENPNGSRNLIAGITNERGNIVGLMPHPEHAIEDLCGPGTDGLPFFTSILKALVK